jgi:hypothetical protein
LCAHASSLCSLPFLIEGTREFSFSTMLVELAGVPPAGRERV